MNATNILWTFDYSSFFFVAVVKMLFQHDHKKRYNADTAVVSCSHGSKCKYKCTCTLNTTVQVEKSGPAVNTQPKITHSTPNHDYAPMQPFDINFHGIFVLSVRSHQ